MRVYVDRGYPGAQKMYEEVEVLEPIRRKPGKKLPALGCVLLRYTCPIARHIDLRIAGPPSV